MNMRDHRLFAGASKRRRANAVSILVALLVLQIAGAPYGFARAQQLIVVPLLRGRRTAKREAQQDKDD